MSAEGGDVAFWKELSKPLVKILDMVQSGFGSVWERHGIVRRAQAESEAMLIKARSEIEADFLLARATGRSLAREVKRQLNFESIVRLADREMPRDTGPHEPEALDEDWIAAFLNCAQDVSDREMQQLWARLLAGEIKEPNSFSRRTLSVVRDLGKSEAEEFAALCGWRVQFIDPPEVYLVRPPKTNRRTPSSDLDNLASLGLIYVEREELYAESFRTKQFVYGERWWTAEYSGEPTNAAIYRLPLGVAQLTRAGEELARLIPWTQEEQVPSQIVEYWEASKWEIHICSR